MSARRPWIARLDGWLRGRLKSTESALVATGVLRDGQFDPRHPDWLRDELAETVQEYWMPLLKVAPTCYEVRLSEPDWREIEGLYGPALLGDDLEAFLEHLLRELGSTASCNASIHLVLDHALTRGGAVVRPVQGDRPAAPEGETHSGSNANDARALGSGREENER